VLTNDKDIYTRCDGYSDHGHDHQGMDRGAELHPFLGYNFRISELHAAVGLAQIRKLDRFLAIQKRNHAYLKETLSRIPGVEFRVIPDPEGDSHTFLSWFLPTAESTQAVIAEMKNRKIFAGNFYWYEHNWHYIRKWDHLKRAETLYPLTEAQTGALKKLQTQDFSRSDAVMSRCISTAIGLSWTEEQLAEKAESLAAAVRQGLANVSPQAHYSNQGSPA
jgi:8-amino-3,8-dideoxy-alpha-D-manno-octulosonate transaminase